MDEQVAAAVTRWPKVPDVYGWLSLSERGQWRLHENGTGWVPGAPGAPCDAAGEAIASTQICAFINRNYAGDALGRWYFQNGPQRVYVRLDAAPYIVNVGNTVMSLETHNGLAVHTIDSWWIDDSGRLYACTEHGPGLISGRDTPTVFEALYTSTGEPLLSILEPALSDTTGSATNDLFSAALTATKPKFLVRLRPDGDAPQSSADPAPLHFCPAAHLPSRLGFTRCPAP